MTKGLGAPNYEPGTLIRDKKTKTDYIIQSSVATAETGAALLYLIYLHNRNLTNIEIPSKSHFDQLFTVLRTNPEGDTVEQVATKINTQTASMIPDEHVEEIMGKVEYQDLQDLFHMIGSIDPDKSSRVNTELVSLAEELIKGLGVNNHQVPPVAEIRRILKDSVSAEITPEYIEEFLKGYEIKYKSTKFKKGILNQSSNNFLSAFLTEGGALKNLVSAKTVGLFDYADDSIPRIGETRAERAIYKQTYRALFQNGLGTIVKGVSSDPETRAAQSFMAAMGMEGMSLSSPQGQAASEAARQLQKRLKAGKSTRGTNKLMNVLLSMQEQNNGIYALVRQQRRNAENRFSSPLGQIARDSYPRSSSVRFSSLFHKNTRPSRKIAETNVMVSARNDYLLGQLRGKKVIYKGETRIANRALVSRIFDEHSDRRLFIPAATFNNLHFQGGPIDLDEALTFHRETKKQLEGIYGEDFTNYFESEPITGGANYEVLSKEFIGTIAPVNSGATFQVLNNGIRQEHSNLAELLKEDIPASATISMNTFNSSTGETSNRILGTKAQILTQGKLIEQMPVVSSGRWNRSLAPSEVFEQARRSTSIAFKAVKDTPFVFGSDIDLPLEHQLQLAKKFYADPKSAAILDLETYTRNGMFFIHEASLARENEPIGEFWSVKKGTYASYTDEYLTRFEKLVDSMDGIEVIATKGNFDIENMEIQLDAMARARPGKLETIGRLRHKLQDIYHNRLFSAELIPQLAGHRLGKLSQERLAMDILNVSLKDMGKQHTADYDVQQLYQILGKVKDQFLENADNLKDVKSMTYLDENPMSNTYGMIIKNHGIFEHGSHFSALLEEMSVEGTELRGTGNFRALEGLSASHLGGMLHKGTTPWNSSMVDRYHEIGTDVGARKLRSLNPFNRTYQDPTGKYGYDELDEFGPYNILNFKLDREAKSLLPEYHEALAGHSLPKHVLERPEAVHKFAEDFLSAKGYKEGVQREILTYKLADALPGTLTHKALTDSQYGNFLSSKYADMLTRVSDESTYGGLLGYFDGFTKLIGRLKEKGFETEVETTPRISLSLAGKSAKGAGPTSGGLNSSIELNTGTLVDGIDSLVAKVVAENNTDNYQYLGLTEKEAERLHEASAALGAREGYASNLGGWKKTIATLRFDVSDSANSHENVIARMTQKMVKSKGMEELVTEAVHSGNNADINATVAGRGNQRIRDAFAVARRDKGGIGALDHIFGKMSKEQTNNYTQKVKVIEYSSAVLDDATFVHESEQGIMANIQEWETRSESIGNIWENIRKTIAENREAGMTGADIYSGVEQHIKMIEPAVREAVNHSMHIAGLPKEDTVKEASTAINLLAKAITRDTNVKLQASQIAQSKLNAPLGMSKFAKPLMALSAALALSAGINPKPDFSQGKTSRKAGIDPIIKNSEIPGDPDKMAVWSGSTDPFRIDITFEGFVQSKRHQEELVRNVYNMFDSEFDIRNNYTYIEDNRNRDHRTTARDIMRKGM